MFSFTGQKRSAIFYHGGGMTLHSLREKSPCKYNIKKTKGSAYFLQTRSLQGSTSGGPLILFDEKKKSSRCSNYDSHSGGEGTTSITEGEKYIPETVPRRSFPRRRRKTGCAAGYLGYQEVAIACIMQHPDLGSPSVQ